MARTRMASSSLITSFLLDASTSYSKTGNPPPHLPLRLAAAILSRVRSAMSSLSNWAKEAQIGIGDQLCNAPAGPFGQVAFGPGLQAPGDAFDQPDFVVRRRRLAADFGKLDA